MSSDHSSGEKHLLKFCKLNGLVSIALKWLWVLWGMGYGTAVAQQSSATINWVSDPVSPGQTLIVVGNNLPLQPMAVLSRVNDEVAQRRENQKSLPLEVLQSSMESLKFTIPDLARPGLYQIRIAGKDNRTTEFFVNRPAIWWHLADQGVVASIGGWVRIFGKNLSGLGEHARVELVEKNSSKPRILKAVAVSPWDARIELPHDLAIGIYRVRIHNGWGAKEGWSEYLTVEIARPTEKAGRLVDIRKFGARGGGREDDTDAIKAALIAVGEAGGGVVSIPRGRFRLSAAINIPPGVTLRGAGKALTALQWDDFAEPPKALINGSRDFVIEDMSIHAGNHIHLISGNLPAAGKVGGNIRIERVVIRASRYFGHLSEDQVDARFRSARKADGDGGDAISLGGENLVVRDCDVYSSGRPIFLYKPRAALISGNRFYTGRWGWYSISGADGVVFEDNEVIGADLMSSGGGINNLRGNRLSQNVWFARNSLSLFHGWDREAMTSDAGGGIYQGKVRDVAPSQFRLAEPPAKHPEGQDAWSGAGVFILGGKGAGQYRHVTKVSSDLVSVDRPWKDLPDDSSQITITAMQRRYHFIGNRIADAGVAIQFYGTSIEHVVAGNKALRAGSIYNSGRHYQHLQPSWYNMFLANEIIDGNVIRGGANNSTSSGDAFLGSLGLQVSPNKTPLAIGSVIRGNHLHANAHINIVGIDVKAPGIRDVVVEGNTIEKSVIGVRIDAGVRGLVVRRNRFNEVENEITNASPAGSGNLVGN